MQSKDEFMLVALAREATVRVETPDLCFDGTGTVCSFSGCSGFFHPAIGSTGVILCVPWGFEELVLRGSWRQLAESIATAGYPCLRFDYPGTGNSIGRGTDAGSMADWVASIDAAIEYVRGNAGVRRFVLVGQSLGAALAVHAAIGRDDVVGLQLITPVVEGAVYVRDLAAMAKHVADRFGTARDPAAEGTRSFAGFSLSAAMVASLKGIDLRALDRLGVESIVVYDRFDRRESAQAAERLRRLGPRVEIERIAPSPLFVADSIVVQPLPVDAARLVARLADLHPVFASQQPAPARMLPSAITTETFREQPIRFGVDESLFGLVCRPVHERMDTPAVVFLDRGGIAHVGWGRRLVEQARALAAEGITSLRFDLSGLGESRESGASTHLDLGADVSAAVDVFAARGHRRIILSGISNGAYAALTAAQGDPRVTDIIAVNPPCFVADPESVAEAASPLGLGGRVILHLIRDRDRIAPALRRFVRRGVKAALARMPLRLRAMLPSDPKAAQVERLFAAFGTRGTRVSLIYSAGDPGLTELRTYFGPNGMALPGPTITVSILPDADHLVTTQAASAWVIDHIADVARSGRPQTARPPAQSAYAPRHAVCST